MKLRRHRLIRVGLGLLGGLAGLALSGAEATDLLLPTKRAEFLVQAVKAQQAKVVEGGEIPNPFYPAAFGAAAVEGGGVVTPATAPMSAGVRTDKDLLQAIAASIKPSGYFILGGEQALVFGQKRVKAGGVLTITFEGTDYILEITAINRTHFTLRLNREEFTRPTK